MAPPSSPPCPRPAGCWFQDQHDPDHGLWNRLIIREHPLQGAPLVGAQLRYLIRSRDRVAEDWQERYGIKPV